MKIFYGSGENFSVASRKTVRVWLIQVRLYVCLIRTRFLVGPFIGVRTEEKNMFSLTVLRQVRQVVVVDVSWQNEKGIC